MQNIHLIVRTSRTGALLGRLTEFRLKQAARQRDDAIADAHDRYEQQVRAILSQNFEANYALRRGEPANAFRWPWLWGARRKAPAPALATPYRHALTTGEAFDAADLLAQHGYRRRAGEAP